MEFARGPSDPAAADGSPGRAGPNEPASRAIAEALSAAVARLRPAIERARAGDPEGVRRLRTSSRRLRSQLQAFRALIKPKWGARVIAELRWLGASLGEPRDLDVLRDRLVKGESEDDLAALKPLLDWVAERREKAGVAADRTLQGRRFRDLMAELERSAASPPTIKRASRPCRKVLPPLIKRAWTRLRRDARDLRRGSPDPEFHEVRNRAKRARYTTELLAPSLGSGAERRGARLARFARSVQDVLGAHQDAVVAASEVDALLARGGHDDAFRLAASSLLARLRHDAEAARDAFLEDHLPKLGKRKYRGELRADG